MIRRVLIALGSVVLVAVLVLALAPALVGPAPLVRALQQRALQLTGHPLTIDGPVSWALLPSPALQAAGLHLANVAGGAAADLASVRRIEAHLAFWPLLTGRIDIADLTIETPTLNLEILGDGRRNWERPPAPPAPSVPGAPAGAPRQPTPLVLRQVTVSDGTASFARPGHRSVTAALTLAAEGDTVPLGPELQAPGRALVSLRGGGLKLDAALLLSRPVPSGLPAKLTLDLAERSSPDSLARLTFDGVGDGATLSGAVGFASDRPSLLDDRLKAAGFASLPDRGRRLGGVPVRLSGWMRASAGLLDLTSLEGWAAGLHLSGRLAIPLAHPSGADIDLAFSAIDLDHIPERGTPPAATGSPPAAPAGPAAAPAGIIHLATPSLTWRGQVLRTVDLTAHALAGAPAGAILPDRIDIDRASATLPGDGRLALHGAVTELVRAPHFAGHVEARVPDLRTLLAASGHPVAAIEPGRLANASFTGDLVADRRAVSASTVDLQIDASHVTGRASIGFGARPAIALALDADDLNLDGYLPAIAAPPLPARLPAALGRVSPLAVGAGLILATGLLRQADIDLALGVRHLLWRDVAFDGVRLAGAVKEGRVTLRELGVGSALGASLRATASFLPSGPHGAQISLGVDAAGEDLGRVARALATALPPSLDLAGPFQLHATAATGLGGGRADVALSALGGKMVLGGTQTSFGRQVEATLSLEHPSFAGLVGRLTRRYRPIEDGPLALSAALSRTPAGWTLTRAAARAGTSSVEATGSVDLVKGRRRVTAMLTAARLDLDRLLPPPALPFLRTIDLRNLGGFDGQFGLKGEEIRWNGWTLAAPVLNAKLAAGLLSLRELSGRMLGGAFSVGGSARANRLAGERVALTLSAALRDAVWTPEQGPALPLLQPALTLARGRFTLGAELQSRGTTVGDLVQGMTGLVSASAVDGAVGGLDLGVIGRALAADGQETASVPAAALGRGQTPFASAQARLRFSNGSVAIDRAGLKGPDGEAAATGGLDLVAGSIAARLALTLPGRDGTPGLRLEGPLAQPSFVPAAAATEGADAAMR